MYDGLFDKKEPRDARDGHWECGLSARDLQSYKMLISQILTAQFKKESVTYNIKFIILEQLVNLWYVWFILTFFLNEH